ncbi:MAG: polyhydroxyalkanoate synthesis repressor PhaR [Gammaproteobacteria bacterium]|nr:MAG: polyhydroxyalkanoate synthesis repressor PhaR [Gammaproteobacteria bacterium]
MRLLKKYPNRRLYDTQTSSYVTLSQVYDLVRSGEEIQIIDSDSEEDITRSVLLQIILEMESKDEPLLSADVLSDLIRFYGNTVPDFFSSYLQDSLSMFASQQQQLQKSFTSNPIDAFTSMAENNLAVWNQLQNSLLNPVAAKPQEAAGKSAASKAKKPKKTKKSK